MKFENHDALKQEAGRTPPLLRRIAYSHGSETRHFMLDLLRVLKRRCGSEIHIYCYSDQQTSFYARAFAEGDIDSVTTFSELYTTRPVAREERERVIEEARENERRLGTSYNRLIMGQRTFGRSFSPGGFYHPRATYAEEADYYQVLDAFNRAIANWERAFDEHDFTLVIKPTLELGYVAERRRVPTRDYMLVGQDNLYYWTTNRYDESIELDRIMEKMPDQPPMDIKGTYGSNVALMAEISRESRFLRCCYLAGLEAIRRWYWRVRGYQKARSYKVREIASFYFRRRRQMLELGRLAKGRSKDLVGRRFVFFPLHEEPESILTIGAPERINQLAVIAAIARDLPAGVILAVKETMFGVGRRPSEFYQQIADFKNVVLLDVAEQGLEVARAADAVVTIRGTVGQEAAILGRPVVYVSHHSTYKTMPHVRQSDLDCGLKDALAWALDEKFDRQRARIDGARFYMSLRTICVDMRGYDLLKETVYDPDLPAAAVSTLIRSLSYETIGATSSERTAGHLISAAEQ